MRKPGANILENLSPNEQTNLLSLQTKGMPRFFQKPSSNQMAFEMRSAYFSGVIIKQPYVLDRITLTESQTSLSYVVDPYDTSRRPCRSLKKPFEASGGGPLWFFMIVGLVTITAIYRSVCLYIQAADAVYILTLRLPLQRNASVIHSAEKMRKAQTY